MGKLELLPNEQILATVKGDCWEAPGILEQVPGVYTFTDRRIIFQGNGLIEKLRLNFEIPYRTYSGISSLIWLYSFQREYAYGRKAENSTGCQYQDVKSIWT